MNNIKLIQGDCINVMDNLIHNNVKVDLVVTSPPYDNTRKYDDNLEWDFTVFKKIADRLYNILTDGGVVVWIVGDATINGSETGTSFQQALYFKSIGFNLHDTMIYHKTSITFPQWTRYYNSFEYMFILSKGKPKTVNLLCDRPNRQAGCKVSGGQRELDDTIKQKVGNREGRSIKEYGVRQNVWTYDTGFNKSAKNKIAYKHPAIAPLKLVEDHIKSWSNPSDLVLDCFMGSGTTGVACQNLNRDFIGIEIVEDYYKIAEQRLKDNNYTRLEDYDENGNNKNNRNYTI